MQFERFAAGHPKSRVHHREYAGNQQELLETADQWSEFFADTLGNYLTANQRVAPKAARQCLQTYHRWLNTELSPVFNDFLDGHWTKRSTELVNHLNFHALNDAFLPQWFQLLTHTTPSQQMSAQIADNSQLWSGINAVHQMRQREKIPTSQYHVTIL
jgi:hypothetical protein